MYQRAQRGVGHDETHGGRKKRGASGAPREANGQTPEAMRDDAYGPLMGVSLDASRPKQATEWKRRGLCVGNGARAVVVVGVWCACLARKQYDGRLTLGTTDNRQSGGIAWRI